MRKSSFLSGPPHRWRAGPGMSVVPPHWTRPEPDEIRAVMKWRAPALAPNLPATRAGQIVGKMQHGLHGGGFMRKLLAFGAGVGLSLSVTTGVLAQTVEKKTLSFE